MTEDDPALIKVYRHGDPPNRGDARLLIAEKLAEHDLNEAMNFVANHGENTSGNMLRSVSLALPKGDPLALHEALTKVQDHANYEDLLSQSRGIWRTTDPKSIVDSLLEIGPSKVQHDLLGEALGQWAETDLQATRDFLQGFPKDTRSAWVEQALSRLDRFAPIDQVVEFVESLEVDQLPASFIEDLGQRHPMALAKMLEELPEGTARQESHQVYARTLADSQGEGGLDWLANVSPADRAKAVRGFAEGWLTYDPAATSEWLAQEPRGTARDQGVAALASHLIKSDREAAFAWGSTIEEPVLRQASLGEVIPSWRNIDSKIIHATIDSAAIPAREKVALRALIPSMP